MLDLLQKPEFREAVVSTENALFIHSREFYHWQWYRRNRDKEQYAIYNMGDLVEKVLNKDHQ